MIKNRFLDKGWAKFLNFSFEQNLKIGQMWLRYLFEKLKMLALYLFQNE